MRIVVPDAKVRDYLLNAANPGNRGKATFFARFGFHRAEWQVLQAALVAHFEHHRVIRQEDQDPGGKLVKDGPLPAPDGRAPRVRTIWLIDTDAVRLITAYPAPLQTAPEPL